jgi:hypothetical protein
MHTAFTKVTKGIKDERTSLEAQLKYYNYMLNNIGVVVGSIDRKIDVLAKERSRYVWQFGEAPRRIKDIELRLKGLDKKKETLLVAPRVERVIKWRRQLIKMGMDV